MTSSKIAVVGGGIAGCSAAYALNQKGFQVTLFEQENALAAGTSGHPLAVFKPRLQKNLDPYGAFYLLAYQFSLALYDKLDDEFGSVWHPARGVFQAALDEKDAAHLKTLSASFPDLADHFHFDEDRNGLNFLEAGCLYPENLCRALTEGVEVVLGKKLENDPTFDVTVLANGTFALQGLGNIPFRLTRGQINYLPAIATQEISETLSFPGGYLTPKTLGDFHILGTTFQEIQDPGKTDWQSLRQADLDKNLGALRAWNADLADPWKNPELLGRTGLRVETPDHLPIVGAAFDEEKFISVFKEKQKLHHTRRSLKGEADISGQYVLSGLAGRGFMSGPLLGEILGCQIAGTHAPCPDEVTTALTPGRFLQKALLAGKLKAT